MLAAFAISAIAFSVNPISMGVTTNPAARMTHVRMDAGIALKVCGNTDFQRDDKEETPVGLKTRVY